jgi:hypothetical protein
MADEKDTTMDDYQAQVEQHEFIKRQGVEAYADFLVSVLGDKLDEDKKILVKQGMTELLAGPPRFPPLSCPPAKLYPIEVDAEFISPIFEERDEANGVTRVWDWGSIAAGSTHCERGTETVTLFDFEDPLITLRGEAAESFWKWQEAARKGLINGQPVRVHRRSARNPRGSRRK